MSAQSGRGDFTGKETKKRRNDVILIAALLVTASLMGLCFFLLRGEGSTVTVEVDGRVFGSYSLSTDRRVDIPTGDGELNCLVIRDGKAYMETATCPDGICVSHRPISRKGESIVCLPHKVVVTVIGGEAEAPDVVA
jgi:hypothetical protein